MSFDEFLDPLPAEFGGATYRWDVQWSKYSIGGSRLNRWRLKLALFRWRARDAWDVLTGKRELDD